MKQVTLSRKDIRSLNYELHEMYGVDVFFHITDLISVADDTYILRDGEVVLFYKQNKPIPTLREILKNNFLKKIVVNMGAVPFIAKGADLMRPGIVSVDAHVREGDIVAIVDENHLKPIAIGQSLFSKEEMQGMEEGKMVINLHHVGDDVWNLSIRSE